MNCGRCNTETAPDVLEALGGVCSSCLQTLIREEPYPQFPGLTIQETIGHGGMGVVYRAVQSPLDRVVALKALAPRLARNAQFVERFEREAQALSQLSHPHIVAVHGSGVHEGVPYLVMEYVEGTPLRRLMARGEVTPDRVLALIPQICEALQYAHGRGIIHRDVKPENILVDRSWNVKLADFGLAKLSEPDGVPLTRADGVVGTPHYMAPEQLERPRTVDHRADIYSLGVVFYELLTGELPLGRFAPPSQRAEVSARVDPVVLKSLEKEPENRYQSADEVRTRVQGLGHIGRPRWRRVRWALGAALLLGALAMLWPRSKPEPVRWDAVGGVVGNGEKVVAEWPSIAVGADGAMLVAWQEGRTMRLSAWNGSEWAEEASAKRAGSTPRVAMGPGGHAVALWQDGPALLLMRRQGAAWGAPEVVFQGEGLPLHPSVAVDAQGRASVAWLQRTASSEEIYVRRWDGAHWSDVGTASSAGGGISGTTTPSRHASIALDREGRPVVAWDEGPLGRGEICVRRWNGSTWVDVGESGPPSGISRTPGDSIRPSLAMDADDRPVVAWFDTTAGNREIYARRWDGSAWVEFGGSATGGGVSASPGHSGSPTIAVDSRGRILIAWDDLETGLGIIRMRAWDGGEWRQEAGDGLISAGFHPALVIDRAGHPLIAFDGANTIRVVRRTR